MAVVDDTWARIVLEHESTAGVKVYFRYVEHGGLTRDALEASYVTQADAGLDFMIQQAKKEKPDHAWQMRRLIVRVEPFQYEDGILKLVERDVRQRALAKLTPREIEVLGL